VLGRWIWLQVKSTTEFDIPIMTRKLRTHAEKEGFTEFKSPTYVK
jgi:hypothetical protein